MEEQQETMSRVNQGRNVARFRSFKGMKQEELAEKLNITQQTLSYYEQRKEIKPEVLQQIAVILDLPLELLQNLPDDSTGVVIENNTFEDGSVGNIAPYGQHEVKNENFNNTYNPVNEMAELFKEIHRTNQDTISKLEKRIADLEGKK